MARKRVVLKKHTTHNLYYQNASPREYLEKCTKEELIEFTIQYKQ
jgi:hypothetical protein